MLEEKNKLFALIKFGRSFFLEKKVQGLITDFGDEMHCQFFEILCGLLDSHKLPGPERDIIIEIFYQKHMGGLIDAITSSCPEDGFASINVGVKPEILLGICELLCFCVRNHPHRIESYFLPNNVMDKVLYLTRRREKYLVVAAVRFFRAIVSQIDEHASNYIVEHNVLKPIVDVFLADGNRFTLLNSAVLELFQYIRKENLTLVAYIVDCFWDELSKYEKLASVRALRVKYEQSLCHEGSNSSFDTFDSAMEVDEHTWEKEEEDSFNKDITSRSAELVDDDDDKGNEDHNSPPMQHSDTPDAGDGVLDFPSKRKMGSKDEQQEQTKKQKIDENLKPDDSVFATLCSTLSQVVLPDKMDASATHITSQGAEAKENTVKEDDTDNKQSKLDDRCSDVKDCP